jgi:hypothetical protein
MQMSFGTSPDYTPRIGGHSKSKQKTDVRSKGDAHCVPSTKNAATGLMEPTVQLTWTMYQHHKQRYHDGQMPDGVDLQTPGQQKQISREAQEPRVYQAEAGQHIECKSELHETGE